MAAAAMAATTIYPEVKEGCGWIYRIVHIARDNDNLWGFVSDKGLVNVYKGDGGSVIRTLDDHAAEVCAEGLMGIGGDTICTMDRLGHISTWATTGHVLDKLKLDVKFSSSSAGGILWKLNDNTIAADTGSNTISILEHTAGRSLANKGQLKVLSSTSDTNAVDELYDMAGHGEYIVALGASGKVEVWNHTSRRLVRSLKGVSGGGKVAINDKYIVVSSYNSPFIQWYEINQGEFAMVNTLDLKTPFVTGFTFVSPDTLMVTCDEGAFFISLLGVEIIAKYALKLPPDNSNSGRDEAIAALCGAVLPDGRVCVGSKDGFLATFQPPEKLRGDIKAFAEKSCGIPKRALGDEAENGVCNKKRARTEISDSISEERKNQQQEERTDEVSQLKKELGALKAEVAAMKEEHKTLRGTVEKVMTAMKVMNAMKAMNVKDYSGSK